MISKQTFYLQYNKNSSENLNRGEGPVDARLFLRDLSLPLAYFLAQKRVMPNVITAIFGFLSILGTVIFIIPGYITIILLILFLELAQLLDCVDGQLARYFGISSKYGEEFDTLAHLLTSASFIFAFGIRMYLIFHNPIFIILGGIGLFTTIFEYELLSVNKNVVDVYIVNKLFKKFYFGKYLFFGFKTIISEIRIFAILLLAISIFPIGNSSMIAMKIVFLTYIIFKSIENTTYLIVTIRNKLGYVKKIKKGWN